jgi:hypothetical protein
MIGGKALYPWEPYNPSDYKLVYLSLGAGVQSSVLYALSALGLHGVPRADVSIFADTHDEPNWVYDHLERLREWGKQYSMDIEIVSMGSLSDDPFMKVPAFTMVDGSPSITRRQCTADYKIKPINRRVRELLEIPKGHQARGRVALSLQGISSDEMQRMKDPREKFVDFEYPLVRLGWNRYQCLEWWEVNMPLPMPKKSACVYCPFRSNSEWLDVQHNDPSGWDYAVKYDEKIRNSTKAGSEWPAFLHRSCVPLGEVDFTSGDDSRDLFLNECEGMCGI